MDPTRATDAVDTARSAPASGSGLLMFARYAYPPNLRGYCGPGDSRALLEYGAGGVVDPGLAALARDFTGPWPYLTLLAAATGIEDPFDVRLVEAYWIGNRLLERVSVAAMGATLTDAFRPRAGTDWGFLAEAIPAGALPHHGFHVFGVYPWVGLLADTGRGEPLMVLDRCRIRWGRVVESMGETVVVRNRTLDWDGRRLHLGAPRLETARQAVDGYRFIDPLEPGEWVSLHWDWVCDRLTPTRLASLRRYTAHQLEVTNRRVAHPGPAVIL